MIHDLERFAKLADHAAAMIPDGAVIGLGSGRTATAFLYSLSERVEHGLRVTGVPTSEGIATLATSLGIPTTTLDQAGPLDVDVDGADEVDPNLDLIKGLGGALVREKIVAASAKKLIIVVTPEKMVPVLGQRGILPVEVVPFGMPLATRKLQELGLNPTPRQKDQKLFVTDNGNHILDCGIKPIASPKELEQKIRAIPGVVDTGLFLGMADTVLVQDGDKLIVKNRLSPQDPDSVRRARQLRQQMTPTETILWKELRGRRFAGFKFRRQRPVGIYYADFLCADCMLVVEADGESHLQRTEEDKQRDTYFEQQDLKVLRFWNTEIHDELESVLETIYRECVARAGRGTSRPREWRPA